MLANIVPDQRYSTSTCHVSAYSSAISVLRDFVLISLDWVAAAIGEAGLRCATQ